MSKIKSLPLCHATAEESLSRDCCIRTCLPAAPVHAQRHIRKCGAKEERKNKWAESKMKEMELRLRCEWQRKEVNEEKPRKNDCKRNRSVLQEHSPGLSKIWMNFYGWKYKLHDLQFSWNFLRFNEIIFIFSLRIEQQQNQYLKNLFEHWCPFSLFTFLLPSRKGPK